jgi:hypothetical protein
MYRAICEAIHKELGQLEDKYSSGAQMSANDLEDIDKMGHALKCLKTYEAMEGNSEYDGSYARGRSRMTGRYVSRDDGYDSRDGSYRRY